MLNLPDFRAIFQVNTKSCGRRNNDNKFWLAAVCILLVVVPWISPFAPGPSPAVVPFLVSIVCAALLLGIVSWESASLGVRRLVFIVACAWLCSGVISAGIGLLQYFGVAETFLPWVNQVGQGNAFANLRQRNQFASLTNISLAALVWFSAGFTQNKHLLGAWQAKSYQTLLLMAALLLVCGNVASLSRTGMVELLLLVGLCMLWGQGRQRPTCWILLLALVTYAVAVVALPRLAKLDLSHYSMGGRLSVGDALCVNRMTLWSNVFELITLKPWTGWGGGELDYAHYMTLFDGPRFCEILDNAHNLPLHLAVEFGVPLAVFLCAGFGIWVIRQKPWNEKNKSRQMAWSVLLIILLHSMLEYPLWYGPFQIAFLLCIGFLCLPAAALSQARLEVPLLKSLRVRVACAALSVLLLVMAVYAAWDYHRISQIYLAPEARDAAYRTDTLVKISDSWLFADQVLFAHVMTTPLTVDNAAWTFDTANALLHYSPEPRVAEKVIESAVMLGKDDEAMRHMARYRAAFPKEYALWIQAKAN